MSTKPDGIGPDMVAIQALAFIAADDQLMSRFLALTGLDVADLRAAAAEPGFLVAVLDFLGGHEPDLVAFAQSADLTPEAVVAARHALAGPDRAGYDA